MEIKYLAHIISSLVLIVTGLAPITGYAKGSEVQLESPQMKRYNIGNKPSYSQWNSKETGNLVVVFTAQDSPGASQAVQGIYKYSMLLNKDKTNIAFKDFKEDNFSCFILRPGEYTIKSILTTPSKSEKSTISYTKFVVKSGQTTAVWADVNNAQQPLLVKSALLDREKTQYVYATATSDNSKIRLNPGSIFEHQIPQVMGANGDQLKIVNKLEAQMDEVRQDTDAIRTHSATVEQDVVTKTKTLEPLYKWKRLVLDKEEATADNLGVAKRNVERALESINDLKNKQRNIQQKMVHFSEWLSRGRAANVQDKLAVIASKRELDEMNEKINNSELTITNLSSALKKKKQNADSLFKKYEELTAEQAVLSKICHGGTKAKVEANGALALLDKKIADQRSKKKQAKSSMESLMTSDKVSDEKLAEINATIKDIDSGIKTLQAERQAALDTIDSCLLKLGKDKEKLNSASNQGFELLKNIELAKKEVDTTELLLNKAKLSQKDLLVDKKLLESRLHQAEAGIAEHSSRGEEFSRESEDLKNEMAKLKKEERAENQRVAGLRKIVKNAQEIYDTANNNLKLIEKKIESTENSIEDLKKVLVSNKERERLLAVSVEEIDSKIRIARNSAKLKSENGNYRSHKAALNKTIDELREREIELENVVKSEKLQLITTKKQVNALELELKGLKNQLAESRKNSASGENMVKKTAENLRSSEVARNLLQKQLASTKKELSLQQRELAEFRDSSSKLERELSGLKEQIEDLNRKAREKDQVIVQIRSDINEHQAGNKEKDAVISKLKEEVSEALATLKKERAEHHEIQLANKRLEGQVKLAEDKVKSATECNDYSQELTRELKKNQKAFKERIAALEAELKEASRALVEGQIETQIARKELQKSRTASQKEIAEMKLNVEQLAGSNKKLQQEIAEQEKIGKLKDVLVASYSKEIRETRELDERIGYRRVPYRGE